MNKTKHTEEKVNRAVQRNKTNRMKWIIIEIASVIFIVLFFILLFRYFF